MDQVPRAQAALGTNAPGHYSRTLLMRRDWTGSSAVLEPSTLAEGVGSLPVTYGVPKQKTQCRNDSLTAIGETKVYR